MRVLQINNYFYIRGGAERYYFELIKLLEKKNNIVIPFSIKDTRNLKSEYSKSFGRFITFDKRQNLLKKLRIAFAMTYSFSNKKCIKHLLEQYKIDIAHGHNIYDRVSPSVLDVLNKKDIPIILTLHDYKLCCPVYTMFRDGIKCEDCIKGGRYNIILHNCVKGSRLFSCFQYIEYSLHKLLKIYEKNISFFVCPSRFSLKKHLEAGLPAKKLIHIPNFLDARQFEPSYQVGGYVLYVGRLSKEKGILTLLRAVKGTDIILKIVGHGPLRDEIETFLKENQMDNVELLGYLEGDDLKKMYQRSAFAVIPSEWYENAPMTVLESFAYGKPVIGADIGGIPEMIIDGKTGLLFKPGDYLDLGDKISQLIKNPSLIEHMGMNAREEIEIKYSSDIHYDKLMSLYQKTLAT